MHLIASSEARHHDLLHELKAAGYSVSGKPRGGFYVVTVHVEEASQGAVIERAKQIDPGVRMF